MSMRREEWLEIEKRYSIASIEGYYGSKDQEGIPSQGKWQADVIHLLTAICEELWQLRQAQQ
jgi:hypothetical protein